MSACHTRLKQQGKTAVIQPLCNRTVKRDYDRYLYQARHLIENFFAHSSNIEGLPHAIDLRAINFLSAIYLAATFIWLN
ncbi:hypothetical protein [Moorena sp. SIO4G3]|uniref:hypothetical protein n=1 Tax=Moorena sp. SIO4G3 TaxID=2607821 RepID=UPI00142ABCA8|nr:hypothetical protein [Moorena sp. SIO4G3]NEO80666.1 transposase [Moorena sp. SIO4G3]